jgi:penicillin-binding protein 1A
VSSEIYDYDKKLIGQIIFEDRIPVKITDVSDKFKQTIIASEDERFYQHKGFDIRAFFRALFINVKQGSFSQGFSSITQQVARSDLLMDDRSVSITRKLKEVILAYKLEERYTKDEILEFYVNQIFFGFGSYGVESASRNYFGKHAKDLDYAESSLLVAILPAPSIDNPIVNLQGTKIRQDNVLRKLVEQGLITDKQRLEFLDLPYTRKNFREVGDDDPTNYFVDYVKAEMYKKFEKIFLEEQAGLRIFTTLITSYQQTAARVINERFAYHEKSGQMKKNVLDEFGVKQPQVGFVAINPKNGYIQAMIGGRDYANAKWNRAYAQKHPGSAFKIFDYCAAIENKSVTGGSLLRSEPDFSMSGWAPIEWNKKWFNTISTRSALVNSSNMCALRAASRVGIPQVAYFASKMGIKTTVPAYPAITVGSIEVRPVDLCSAYGVLAAQGIRHDPVAILEVQNRDGVVIERHVDQPVRVLSEETSFIMTNIFQSVINAIGKRGFLKIEQAAGKSGTSTDSDNVWYNTFTPEIVCTCYVGSDSSKTRKSAVSTLWGSEIPAPMIFRFMTEILNDKKYPLKKTPFPPKPRGVSGFTFCKRSGMLPGPYCPKEEIDGAYCLPGTEPNQVCLYHSQPTRLVEVYVKRENGVIVGYYKPTIWCPTEIHTLSILQEQALKDADTADCPRPINLVFMNLDDPYKPSILFEEKIIEFKKDAKMRLTITVEPFLKGKVSDIDIYWNNVRIKKIQDGGYDTDENKTVDFATSPTFQVEFLASPSEAGDGPTQNKIILELRGSANYYIQKIKTVNLVE